MKKYLPMLLVFVLLTVPVWTLVSAQDVVLAESLDLNIAVGNNQRTITYNQATPLELPDGTVISAGMLKPTWQYMS